MKLPFRSLKPYPIIRASLCILMAGLIVGVLLVITVVVARTFDNRSCDHALTYCFDVDGEKTPALVVVIVEAVPVLAVGLLACSVVLSAALSIAAAPYYLLRSHATKRQVVRKGKLEKRV